MNRYENEVAGLKIMAGFGIISLAVLVLRDIAFKIFDGVSTFYCGICYGINTFYNSISPQVWVMLITIGVMMAAAAVVACGFVFLRRSNIESKYYESIVNNQVKGIIRHTDRQQSIEYTVTPEEIKILGMMRAKNQKKIGM